MKKIVLYNPQAVFYDMPLSLLALASCFDPKLYHVVIVDARIEVDAHWRVLNEVQGAVCFGVTVLTGAPIRDALEITRKVKRQHPEVPTVWGGWHPSLFPMETLQEEASIDITVQGQGEVTFQKLVQALVSGKELLGLNGLCYRDAEGNLVKNPAREMVNMDQLPPVNYHLLDVEAYFRKKGRRQLDFISSVGCFYRCSFCADPHVFNRKFSAIGPARMGEELQALKERYNFEDVNFQDETFFTYPKRVMHIAQELVNRNIRTTWAATMRADQGDRMTQEDFDLLGESGLRRVLVGVESGSQEMMDWLKKDIRKEQVLVTAERCKKSGIGVQFPFIVGFPDESESAFEASLEFAIELTNMADNFKSVLFYFKPYPGTEITNEVVRNGYKLPNTLQEWARFDYIGSAGPWVSDVRRKKVERLKFYLRMAKNQRTPGLPLKWISKLRLNKRFFAIPVEKTIVELIKPAQKLS